MHQPEHAMASGNACAMPSTGPTIPVPDPPEALKFPPAFISSQRKPYLVHGTGERAWRYPGSGKRLHGLYCAADFSRRSLLPGPCCSPGEMRKETGEQQFGLQPRANMDRKGLTDGCPEINILYRSATGTLTVKSPAANRAERAMALAIA